MSFAYYFKSALRSIGNNKKQSLLFISGIFISITLLVSLRLWSSTAEDLAATAFLENQDFEMKITSYLPEELPEITSWLELDPLVADTYKLYNNLACFNAENKPGTYIWSPEDQQDPADPISITALGLFPKKALQRIENQFFIRGSFNIGLNECLISEFEAAELERVFHRPIEPGMNLTLSVARNSPERSEIYLHQLELLHFPNVTIKGIYRPRPMISMLQRAYSSSFLKDSVIFLSENLKETAIIEMKVNGIEPNIFVKTDTEKMKEDGVDQILNKLNDLANRMKIAFQSSQFILLDAPIQDLLQSYTLSQSAIVFLLPVVFFSLLLTFFTTNIIIESRKAQLLTLKDRGALNIQIITLLLLEFLILTLIGIFLAIGSSFFFASLIPALAPGTFSQAIFLDFLTSVKFPFTLTLYSTIGAIVIISVFIILKLESLLHNQLEERQSKSRAQLQRNVLYGILGALTIGTISLLIVKTLQLSRDLKEVYTYSLELGETSLLVFLLTIAVIILLGLIFSLILEKALSKTKPLLKPFFKRLYFFIANNLKADKYRFTKLLAVFVLLTSLNIYTLNLHSSLNRNDDLVAAYNNGSDLRIQTSYIDLDFKTNLSAIEGINETTFVLRAEGKLIYNSATVYGIEPLTYARIGRWNLQATPYEEITKLFTKLNETEDGAIVSDFVARRLNLTEGSLITVTGLPNSSYIENFHVVGMLHSAPGLGLLYGKNIALNQPNDEFLLINARRMVTKYNVRDTDLFFASLTESASAKTVIELVQQQPVVLDVNPEIINQQFVGNFIAKYIPGVKAFLLFQLLFLNILGISIITTTTNFLIKQRDVVNATLKSLGNSKRNLVRLIFGEMLVVQTSAFLVGLMLGLPFAVFTVFLNKPSFLLHEILPMTFHFNFLGVLGFILILLVLSLFAPLPACQRFTNKSLATILRG